jgi:hypothetical protein
VSIAFKKRIRVQVSLPHCQLGDPVGKVLDDYKTIPGKELRRRQSVFATVTLSWDQEFFSGWFPIAGFRFGSGHGFGRMDFE